MYNDSNPDRPSEFIQSEFPKAKSPRMDTIIRWNLEVEVTPWKISLARRWKIDWRGEMNG